MTMSVGSAAMAAQAAYLQALVKALVDSGALDSVAFTAELMATRKIMEDDEETVAIFDMLVQLTAG
jgi:hypothetical protein